MLTFPRNLAAIWSCLCGVRKIFLNGFLCFLGKVVRFNEETPQLTEFILILLHHAYYWHTIHFSFSSIFEVFFFYIRVTLQKIFLSVVTLNFSIIRWTFIISSTLSILYFKKPEIKQKVLLRSACVTYTSEFPQFPQIILPRIFRSLFLIFMILKNCCEWQSPLWLAGAKGVVEKYFQRLLCRFKIVFDVEKFTERTVTGKVALEL